MTAGLLVAGCGKAPESAAPPAGQAAAPAVPPAPAPAASRTEKDKARAEPYANDLGPATLPAERVASYSAALRGGYELTLTRCAQCHTAARPLNSEFVDTETWRRYVKRMMAKPGCEITGAEGRKIWEFLVHDSKIRKTGQNAAAWTAHRRALLEQFKREHPDRWKLLYGDRPAG